jgi:Phytanoyl-CoA dioxygenase (PhyH).
MDLIYPARLLYWGLGVFGSEKSFARNPVIGSRRLNEMGLHRTRVALAERAARARRARIAARIAPEDRAHFDENGFFLKENYLPQDVFEAVRREVLGQDLPAWEMRQGHTVTRMIPLSERTRALLPTAVSVVRSPALEAMTGYAAGRAGAPVHFIQTVIARPDQRGPDPQTDLHADTFHSTAKFWLFLHDVGEEDGPFIFAPGSHRLTPERLAWEYEQSLTARADSRKHHAIGSFRIDPADLPALGYGAPRRMAVKANTLVVADTYGFHSRAPSEHETMRIELHGHLRRNPFLPWNGLDPLAAPGIKGRQLDLHLARLDRRVAKGGGSVWKNVGLTRADAPPNI